jgi:fumarylpyruvate hydrolase
MTEYLFPPPAVRSIPVVGETAEYPVHRIFCVGRNYADHAKEMGSIVDRSAPFYFTKSLTALAASPARMPYPSGTADYQHEVELVVALGAPLFQANPGAAGAAILGYAVGLDMTRRDLQAASKEKRQPWDTGKDVEGSAIVGAITRRADAGELSDRSIRLTLDGQDRQAGRLSDMVWSVGEILVHLSGLYHLNAGDLIFTGTPAGVGPVLPGNRIVGRIDGWPEVALQLERQQ